MPLRSSAGRFQKSVRAIGVLGVLAFALALAFPLSGSAGARAPRRRKCTSFTSQKAAQKFFVSHRGNAAKDVDGLDPDGDGLVCPANKAPYAAYVGIGFNKGRHFFYGTLVGVLSVDEKAQTHECSGFPEVSLYEVKAGPDPIVAAHKSLATDTKEFKKKTVTVTTFEWKLTPAKHSGTFYAASKECYGTPSARLRTG